mmetsp:Transcript_6682/g.14624  ORF Transcript_6682/g.14624 Transcript_6682/m.14624 type:complete len:248 (-) Transcript_6682:278-1021(-)
MILQQHPCLVLANIFLWAVGVATTLYMVVEGVQFLDDLSDAPVLATHFTSTDCADQFSEGRNGLDTWLGIMLAVSISTFALLTIIAVMLPLVPHTCPGCLKYMNVGTHTMKEKLLRQLARGRFDIVDHAMLILCTYLLFVASILQVGYVPLLTSTGDWNEACLGDAQCKSAMLKSLESHSSSAVCCSDFSLECGNPALFWGAIGLMCVGPLAPLPCTLWCMNMILSQDDDARHFRVLADATQTATQQ